MDSRAFFPFYNTCEGSASIGAMNNSVNVAASLSTATASDVVFEILLDIICFIREYS